MAKLNNTYNQYNPTETIISATSSIDIQDQGFKKDPILFATSNG